MPNVQKLQYTQNVFALRTVNATELLLRNVLSYKSPKGC